MKPTPDQLERALAASYALRDIGIPEKGVMPRSFTKDPRAHVAVIAEAILQDMPEPGPQPVITRRTKRVKA